MVAFAALPLPPDPSSGRPFVVTDGYRAGHRAVDLATRDAQGRPVIGREVFAVVDGWAEWDYDEEAGLYITLSGGDVRVLYAHLSDVDGLPDEGAAVRAGQRIGRSGDSGRDVTGPHLHLAVTVDGQKVDPLPLLDEAAASSSSSGGLFVAIALGLAGLGLAAASSR